MIMLVFVFDEVSEFVEIQRRFAAEGTFVSYEGSELRGTTIRVAIEHFVHFTVMQTYVFHEHP